MKLNVLVPTDISEISLDQFVQIVALEEMNGTTIFQMQKVVEIICGIDLKSVAEIKYSYVKEIYLHIQGLLNKEPEFVPRFQMDSIEYGFIPLLDEMSFGEYIDVSQNMSSWNDMHKAMCVLYRPITHRQDNLYTIKKYDGLSEAYKFKKIPLNVALGANFFFLNLGIELLETTLKFSGNKKMTLQEKEILVASGAGFKASLDSLRAILQRSNILLS
tara:strand:- start:337 stop:987 length:651 start_codon:yes stop_codon:yes gene_type:complete